MDPHVGEGRCYCQAFGVEQREEVSSRLSIRELDVVYSDMDYQIAVREELVGVREEMDPVCHDSLSRKPCSKVALTLTKSKVFGIRVPQDSCSINIMGRN